MRKVLATFLVFLVFISVTAQSAMAEGLLSDFFEMIKKWFESSPLGNIFAMPVKRIETIKLSFHPQTFNFITEDFVNVTTNETEIMNFKGTIDINMENKILLLREEGSSLSVKEKIGNINIEGMKLSSLELKEMELVLVSGNWNETTENGSMIIKDFLGDVFVRRGVIELEGNVSKMTKG